MSATAPMKDRLADYVPVNERLEKFWEQYPNGKVLTTIIEHSADNGFILMRAEVYRDQADTVPAASGHAFEERSTGYVNKTSYLENCETSAVGRALALMGFEIKRGIASRQEMEKVERMTSQPRQVISPKTEREILLHSVKEACGLLDNAGDEPKWTFTRLREYIKTELGAASIDDLGVPEVAELLKRLSLRLDKLNDGRPNRLSEHQCEHGERKRMEGITTKGKNKGKPWAMWGCPKRICEPDWINLDEEAEAEAIVDEGGDF